jgi:hypothetical protein
MTNYYREQIDEVACLINTNIGEDGEQSPGIRL